MSYQTYAVEYTVTERLGGTLRSEPFSIDPRSPKYVSPDAQNIRAFTVEELGIIDLSLIAESPAGGVRFVPWVWIDSPDPPDLPFGRCDIVDSISLKQMQLGFYVNPVSGQKRWFGEGLIVPRGASLRFSNWIIPPASRPLRIRISVVPAESTMHWAEMMQAFCCLRGDTIAAGPTGPTGPTGAGPTGPTGPTGPAGP